MKYTARQQVPYAVEDVWAWFSRPGAVIRLTPPWIGMKVLSEASNLEDGKTVFSLPGGIEWVAQHEKVGYVEGKQFVDYAASAPLKQLLDWRHVHKFAADGPERESALVIDELRSNLPSRIVEPSFAYRHHQLAADLRVQREARQWMGDDHRPLTIAISGAHGLVGTALKALMTTGGHIVIDLVRGPVTDPVRQRYWDVDAPSKELLRGIDVVVHLAGESIAGRFTGEHKQKIVDSRVEPTRKLASVAAQTASVTTFVCASAVGYFGDRGDEVLTEDTAPGTDFLSQLVVDWEAACAPCVDAGKRVVNIRTSVAQSAAGGFLEQMRKLFSLGLGGRLGSGEQWMSWISIDDLCDIFYRAALDRRLHGPVNATAPHPVRNKEFTSAMGRVVRRPALLPVPAFGPKLLLGEEGADLIALVSQRALPTKLEELGHTWRYPYLAGALAHELGREK